MGAENAALKINLIQHVHIYNIFYYYFKSAKLTTLSHLPHTILGKFGKSVMVFFVHYTRILTDRVSEHKIYSLLHKTYRLSDIY